MRIHVNGSPRDVRDPMTAGDLLRDLQLNVAQVAVEINRDILEKQDVDTRMIHEGDHVEILSFIGGGACPAPCAWPEGARHA